MNFFSDVYDFHSISIKKAPGKIPGANYLPRRRKLSSVIFNIYLGTDPILNS